MLALALFHVPSEAMTKISTNAMAKRHLEALGYRVDVTQHWIQHQGTRYGHRRDLFNCIDVVGIKEDEWLNVQACDSENISRAKKQAKQNQAVRDIQEGPTDFEIWEFYNDRGEWWIRRWRCLTAGGQLVDFANYLDEPSLDKEKEKERQKEARRKAKETESRQTTHSGLAGNDTPF